MKKNIHQQVEDTLSSIEGMKRAEPDPFFATRALSRLEKQQPEVISPVRRPVWLVATLCLFLAANIFLLTHETKKTTGDVQSGETSSLQGFAKEYGLTTTSAY